MEGCAVLITAAGSGTRMGGARKKEYLPLRGKPVIQHVLEAFEKTGLITYYMITVPEGGADEASEVLSEWLGDPRRAAITGFTVGSDTRQKSVCRGLEALDEVNPAAVLIHDGARPWISPELITEVYKAVLIHGACVPLTPPVDALKQIDGSGYIRAHLDRGVVRGAQTPQGFRYREILEAHKKAWNDGRVYVDDTEIYAACQGKVFSVPGDEKNRKITYPSDLEAGTPRIGFGYDLHRLVEGRKLLLGGAEIPSPVGEDGHSDGDVLIHAVIDALFGAAGLGDIGSHFPPSDDTYKDISSRILLRRAAELVREANFRVGNLDCTVVLERPKILPYRPQIKANLAEDIGIAPDAVSVKGKTKEKVDAVGEGRAVEAFATVLLV